MAWYGVAGGAGSIAGQVLGGLLVGSDIGELEWRPIFLIAVPVGVVAAALAPIVLRRSPAARGGTVGSALDPASCCSG
jgi:MFS family permease